MQIGGVCHLITAIARPNSIGLCKDGTALRRVDRSIGCSRGRKSDEESAAAIFLFPTVGGSTRDSFSKTLFRGYPPRFLSIVRSSDRRSTRTFLRKCNYGIKNKRFYFSRKNKRTPRQSPPMVSMSFFYFSQIFLFKFSPTLSNMHFLNALLGR